MQTTLDAILRISRVLAFLAILILLLSLNKENALLHTHSKFTHQHHVRMEQSKHISEPNYHFQHFPVQTKHNQFMFNNVDSTTYVVTNTNDEEVRIPTGYYTIGETIVILNTTADTPYLPRIRIMVASGFNPLTLHPFHQCSGYSRDPRFGRTNGHSICFVQSIICV